MEPLPKTLDMIDAQIDAEFSHSATADAQAVIDSQHNWRWHVFVFQIKLFIKRRIWQAQALRKRFF